MPLLQETTKTALIAAATDLQGVIETLAKKWTALLEVYGAAKADAASSAHGTDRLDSQAGLDRIRSLIVEVAKANGLRYVFEGTGRADGTTVNHKGEARRPDGVADLEPKVTRMLGGL